MKAFRIPEPCNVDWRTMTPAEGGRFCGECKKVVKNLSWLTEREARKLLRDENNGQLCVRYAYDKHGKVLFGADAPRDDAPIPVASLLRRVGAAASLAIAAAACTESPLEAFSSDKQQEPQRVDEPQWNQGGAPAEPDLGPPPSDDAGTDAAAATDAGPSTSADAAVDGGAEILPN